MIDSKVQQQKTSVGSTPSALDSTDCITHDMKCSQIAGIDFTDSDGNLQVCPGPFCFKVNILGCCIQHDIDLWCAKDNWDVAAADTALFACILKNTLNRLSEELPWYLEWLFLPLAAVLLVVLAILVGVILALWKLGSNYQEKYLGTGGVHKQSCLCGGNQATECCDPDSNPSLCKDSNGNPKNLCGNPPGCFSCHWECIYDENLEPIGYELIRDPNGRPCCFGTPGPKLPCPV